MVTTSPLKLTMGRDGHIPICRYFSDIDVIVCTTGFDVFALLKNIHVSNVIESRGFMSTYAQNDPNGFMSTYCAQWHPYQSGGAGEARRGLSVHLCAAVRGISYGRGPVYGMIPQR